MRDGSGSGLRQAITLACAPYGNGLLGANMLRGGGTLMDGGKSPETPGPGEVTAFAPRNMLGEAV